MDNAAVHDADAPIADWYATASGREVARQIAGIVRPLLGGSGESRLLALGQTAPVLTRIHGLKRERIAMIVETASRWPLTEQNRAAVADPERLPFADALFDDALLIHALELVERPRIVLRELWRVLTPAGRLVLVVPNRSGVWARVESVPFGRGHPYGRGSLTRLLGEAMFEVEHWTMALAAPPSRRLRWLEAPLSRMAPTLGGVHVVSVRKTDGLRPIGRAATSGRLVTASAAP